MLLLKSKMSKKNIVKGYIIYDLTEDIIRLPNGKVIPKKNIMHIDPEKNIITYIEEGTNKLKIIKLKN